MNAAVDGNVNRVLRGEGLAIFLVMLLLYRHGDWSWGLFLVLFLVPDISFAGYLAGPRIGASTYNVAHSLIGALAVLAWGWASSTDLIAMLGTIWVAHIGFDRAVGYGLKYAAGFGYTHLGRVGKGAGAVDV